MKHKKERGTSRAGEAMSRYATQTAHDVTLGRKGRDLDQNVTDTVKQGTGREAVPPKSIPNTRGNR